MSDVRMGLGWLFVPNHCENVCRLAYVYHSVFRPIASIELVLAQGPKIYTLDLDGSWAQQNAHKHKKMRQVHKKYGFKLWLFAFALFAMLYLSFSNSHRCSMRFRCLCVRCTLYAVRICANNKVFVGVSTVRATCGIILKCLFRFCAIGIGLRFAHVKWTTFVCYAFSAWLWGFFSFQKIVVKLFDIWTTYNRR